jgi:hypothetical protein
MQMSKEPERIWIDDERPIGGKLHVFTDPPVKGAEEFVVGYIRADLAEAKLEEALDIALEECPYWPYSNSYSDWWHDRRVLIEKLRGE